MVRIVKAFRRGLRVHSPLARCEGRVAWVALAFCIGTAAAQGQVRWDRPNVRVDLRYDAVEEGAVRERLQGGLRIEQQTTFLDTVDLVLFVATGDDFASRWVTFYDLRPGADEVDPFRPRLRRLYFQFTRPRYRLQAGAIPPVKAVISPTGLDPAGWIDGARFEWYLASQSTVEFVGGRLGDIDAPSVFDRPFPFVQPAVVNYAEMEVSHHVRPWLRLEGSAEYLRALYARGEVRWIPTEAVELFSEVLYNLDNGAVNYGTTFGVDPVAALFGRNGGRTAVEISHAFKESTIGLRGELSDDFITFGHSAAATVTVQLSRAYGLRARVTGIVAEATAADPVQSGAYTRLKVELGWRLP